MNLLIKFISLFRALIVLVLLLPQFLFAQEKGDSLKLEVCNDCITPKAFRFITNVPGDLKKIFLSPFQRKNLNGLMITVGATLVIVPFDVQISEGVKHFCEQIHLNSKEDYNSPVRFKDARIIKVPQNLNSAFYQWGEGGSSILLAGGLFIYGKLENNPKPVAVAHDITESIITVGLTTQIIKRITGRETPLKASDEEGESEWRQFPAFYAFQTNTPKYDSYPSGHLATMATTLATLMLNYPEKKWIKIVGGTLIGLTGISMINNDVHWMSDYPLALALGFVSAKVTFDRNHRKFHKQVIPCMEN